uniref:Uncharacterized protein n=1 Tax=Rangifer tarandus platyrhynchus TaxID=3082113 RepID=A0ACB0FI75_RANTA|nr:unnamed protein product [Rangifer tarandus platyrhynchus]
MWRLQIARQLQPGAAGKRASRRLAGSEPPRRAPRAHRGRLAGAEPPAPCAPGLWRSRIAARLDDGQHQGSPVLPEMLEGSNEKGCEVSSSTKLLFYNFPLLRKAHQRSLVDFGEEQPPASRKSDGAQFPDCAAVDPGECPPRPEGHGPRSPTKAPPCYPTLPKWVRCPRAVLAVGIHRSSGAGEGAAGGSRVSAVAHTLGQRVFPRLRIWNSAGQRGLAPPAARDRPRALPVRARKAGLLTFVTILPLTLSTD